MSEHDYLRYLQLINCPALTKENLFAAYLHAEEQRAEACKRVHRLEAKIRRLERERVKK